MSEANIILICWYGVIGIIEFIMYYIAKKVNRNTKYFYMFFGLVAIAIIIAGLTYPPLNPF